MKHYTRPMSKLERLIQNWRAKLHNKLDEYDTGLLAGASLLGAALVILVWSMVLQP